MIKMIAFDLDGTIGDTIPFSLEAFRQAVSPYSGHTLSDAEIIQTFGLNETGMIKAVTKEHWKPALKDFYLLYENLHKRCPSPYQGIKDIFDLLSSKKIDIALITGKGEKACNITLEKFRITDRFCHIATGLEYKPNKTEDILYLLHKYHLQKEEFYYVGDAVSDVDSSHAAGVLCLSAAWGNFANTTELMKINPKHIFYTTKEMYEYFLKL